MQDLFEGIKVLAKSINAISLCGILALRSLILNVLSLYVQWDFRTLITLLSLLLSKQRNNYMLRNIEGKTPDEVMMTFKPDWRNRIRKAGRKGVICVPCGTEALDDFYPMMQATGIRDIVFSIRSKEYFVKMIEGLGEEHCRLFMCYLTEEGSDKRIPVSGAVTTQYAGEDMLMYMVLLQISIETHIQIILCSGQ